MKRALIVALLLPATIAHADPEIVGLLDVRGTGVTDVVAQKFADAVDEGLAGSHDFQPAPRDRMADSLKASSWSPACTVGPCLAEVRAQTGADYVVTAGLTGSGESYRFTITLVSTKTGDVIRQMSQSCPACTVEDLDSAATLATIELINNVDAATSPRADAPAPADLKRVEDRVRGHARTLRTAAILTLGVALMTGAVGGYFVHEGRHDVGYPLFGATAGLAASGVTMLGLSFRF